MITSPTSSRIAAVIARKSSISKRRRAVGAAGVDVDHRRALVDARRASAAYSSGV
jgi:hypothetical protein